MAGAFAREAVFLAVSFLSCRAAALDSARFFTRLFSGFVGLRMRLISAALRAASSLAASSAAASSCVRMEMRTIGGATAAFSSFTPQSCSSSVSDGVEPRLRRATTLARTSFSISGSGSRLRSVKLIRLCSASNPLIVATNGSITEFSATYSVRDFSRDSSAKSGPPFNS